MNKENLVNYVKKNKWALLSGVGFVIGGYFLLHTNFSYHLEDRTGKYILNPDYYKFKEVEWTDLKTVYPTKLAYDPAWFKLPPDKYIPKEQPIPRDISNISDPIIRRQAYFNFLCKTEYAAYMTNDIKGKRLESHNPDKEGILDLTAYNFFPKLKNKNSNYDGSSNPFIPPVYFYSSTELKEGDTYDFFYWNTKDNQNNNSNKEEKIKEAISSEGKFIEIFSSEGDIYILKYDAKNQTMFPIFKRDKSISRYYKIAKYTERDSLKNLGLIGVEEVIYDRKENRVVFYIKQFNMGAFLPWTVEGNISNFSWLKQSGCDFKPQYIDKF